MRIKRIGKIYIVVFIIIMAIVVPLRVSMLCTSRRLIHKEAEDSFINGMSWIDKEFLNITKIKRLIEGNHDYGILKKVNRELKNVEYDYLLDMYDEYSAYVKMNAKVSENIFLFENNGIVMTNDNCFANGYLGFDSFFSFKNMSFEELRRFVFESNANMEHFIYDESLKIRGETKPALVYFMPVGENSNSGEYSCMMFVFELENLFNVSGLENKTDCVEFYICSKDKTPIYSNVEHFVENEDTTAYYSGATGTLFMTNLTDVYYNRQMPYSRAAGFLIYLVAAICAGLISFFIFKDSRKRIMGLIFELQSDRSRIKPGEEYDTARRLIKAVTLKSAKADELFIKNLFSKFFSAQMSSDEECEFSEMLPEFNKPYVMIILPQYGISDSFMTGVNTDTVPVKDNMGNDVLFVFDLEMNSENIRGIVDSIKDVAKKQGVMLNAVVSLWCDSIGVGYDRYQKAIRLIRYLDYGENVIYSFDIDEEKRRNDTFYKKIDESVYTYMKMGHEFNVCRLIYEHWYELIQNPYWDDRVEIMFFEYKKLLESFAEENGAKISIEKSLSTGNVSELAFQFADSVAEVIREVMSSGIKSNSEAEQIIRYIENNFCNPTFGLIDIQETFGISVRKASGIIRDKTNKKFTEYIEQKRVEKARGLLSTSNLKMTDIMEMCGFNNESSFYRSFKKLMKITPLAYRGAYTETNHEEETEIK